MSAASLLGFSAVQWLFLLVAFTTLLLLVETALGHYRSGFPLRAQFAPLVSEALLVAACLVVALAPTARAPRVAGLLAGVFAIVTGLVGVGYHHWYGIVKKAGGYRWLLHYLMYGAPPLAPLALALAGAFAVAGALSPDADPAFLSRLILGLAAAGIVGATLQAAILHYRGAFNTRWMYAPFVVPPLAALAVGGAAIAPGFVSAEITRGLLWLTALTGVVGLGMHLRGFDRQMGGLHVFVFNVLQGPPPLAPAILTGFALIGLVGLWLDA